MHPTNEEDLLLKESEILTIPEPVPRRRHNVVIFGEIGAGKSSLVNLILGHDAAKTSRDKWLGCTLDARPYDVTIQGRDFRIFDTVGLHEPKPDPDSTITSINKAYRLVRVLSETGGIDLLVFCVRRSRITPTMQQKYILFNDIFCHKKVPVVLVVTHCEREENMEDWWQHNHLQLSECGIHTVGHACITAKYAFSDRYHASRQMVHDLLLAHGCGAGFTQDKVNWTEESLRKLLDFVGFSTRLDSSKIRAQRLREYGLFDEEIRVALIKMAAVDEDLPHVRPLRRFPRRSLIM